MKISKTHQEFANRVGLDALTNPEPFLGPNYKTVLNFWYYNDTLSKEQWNVVIMRYYDIPEDARYAAWDSTRNAAVDVVGKTNLAAAYLASPGVLAVATYELIAMHNLLGQGKSLVFVPLFDSL